MTNNTAAFPFAENLTSPRLPIELLSLVVSFVSSQSTLASIARSSHALNIIAAPSLYSHLTITRRNVSRLFSGLPRNPLRKKQAHFRNKERWNSAVSNFNNRFGDMLDDAGPLCEEITRAGSKWTDSEPKRTTMKRSPARVQMTTWARKKKLIGYCRSLAVLQLPPKALCHDLVTAIDVDKEDEEVKDLSDSGDLERLFNDTPHPFFALVPMFGNPTAVCVACPAAESPSHDAEYFLRRLRITEDAMSEENVTWAVHEAMSNGDSLRQWRAQTTVSTLLPSVRKLTVHNVRYSARDLPHMSDNENRTYRYEYAPDQAERVSDRALGVTATLAATAPVSTDYSVTVEHVGIGRNVCSDYFSDNASDADEGGHGAAGHGGEGGDNESDDESDDEGYDNEDSYWDDWNEDLNETDDEVERNVERDAPRPALIRDLATTKVIAEVDRMINAEPMKYALAGQHRAVYAPSDSDPVLDAATAAAAAVCDAAERAFQEAAASHRPIQAARRKLLDHQGRAMTTAYSKVRAAQAKIPTRFLIREWVTVAGAKPTKAERDAAQAAYDEAHWTSTERLENAQAEVTEARAELRPLESECQAVFADHRTQLVPLRHERNTAVHHVVMARVAASRAREQKRLQRLAGMPPAEERLRYIEYATTCEVCGRIGGADGESLDEMIEVYTGHWRL